MRTSTRLATAAGIAVVLAVLVIPTAAWAGSLIGVSYDGSTWTPSLAAPLFDPAVRWEPGTQRTARFSVRNQATDAGALAMQASAHDADGLLSRRDGRAHRLAGTPIAAGRSGEVDVRATFDPASPNRSQLERLTLAVQVLLVEAGAQVVGVTEGTSSGHGGSLPNTGGVDRWFLEVGLALMILGAAIIYVTTTEGRR
ncbi:MAG: hypothetical protein JWP74_3741 [Marmoricola sp.]|nr:hypothetical protein [Marmoricola sp.]